MTFQSTSDGTNGDLFSVRVLKNSDTPADGSSNNSSDVKSWGIGQNRGKLYVGSVCTTNLTQGAYISEFNGVGFSPFHQIPLNMKGESSGDVENGGHRLAENEDGEYGQQLRRISLIIVYLHHRERAIFAFRFLLQSFQILFLMRIME